MRPARRCLSGGSEMQAGRLAGRMDLRRPDGEAAGWNGGLSGLPRSILYVGGRTRMLVYLPTYLGGWLAGRVSCPMDIQSETEWWRKGDKRSRSRNQCRQWYEEVQDGRRPACIVKESWLGRVVGVGHGPKGTVGICGG